MNLIKNVDGPWETAKQRTRADLDTIQRTVNELQAALAALTTQVNTPKVIPPPTIAPNGKVTSPLPPLIEPTRTQQFLSTVATNGGLTGDGTVANPLVAVTGVTTAAAGALGGTGTVANPLTVQVDGTTIGINGGNQLVSLVTVPILVATFSTSGTAFSFASAPHTMVAGVASMVIIPIYWAIRVSKNQTAWTGGGNNFSLTYGNGSTATGITSLQTGLAGSGVSVTNTNWTVATGTNGVQSTTVGQLLRLSCSADITGNAGPPVGAASLDVSVYYTLIPG